MAALAVAATAVGAGQVCEQVFWSPGDSSPLVRATFWAVSGLIGVFSSDPVCRPEEAVLGTRDFAVNVAPQCSGCEGMGPGLTHHNSELRITGKPCLLVKPKLLDHIFATFR